MIVVGGCLAVMGIGLVWVLCALFMPKHEHDYQHPNPFLAEAGATKTEARRLERLWNESQDRVPLAPVAYFRQKEGRV